MKVIPERRALIDFSININTFAEHFGMKNYYDSSFKGRRFIREELLDKHTDFVVANALAYILYSSKMIADSKLVHSMNLRYELSGYRILRHIMVLGGREYQLDLAETVVRFRFSPPFLQELIDLSLGEPSVNSEQLNVKNLLKQAFPDHDED